MIIDLLMLMRKTPEIQSITIKIFNTLQKLDAASNFTFPKARLKSCVMLWNLWGMFKLVNPIHQKLHTYLTIRPNHVIYKNEIQLYFEHCLSSETETRVPL